MLEIEKLSKKYMVRKINNDDIHDVFDLCKENTMFYDYCPPFVSVENIKDDLVALPPNKTINDKYYIGFYDGNVLIAVMDLILGYPNENTGFIGFFMVNKSFQNKGIGSFIIKDTLNFLNLNNYFNARLGWIDGNNQSENFWKKNGFVETGEKSKTDQYTIVVAERKTKIE